MNRAENIITTKKITRRDAAEFLAAAHASRELHQTWVDVPQTPTAFRRYATEMRTESDMAYLVRRIDTGQLAGVIELRDIFMGDFCNAYVIYYAFAGHTGQGFMAEALKRIIRIAFTRLKLHRLEANIQPDNHASLALATVCGFNKEGYSPKFLRKGGQWRDHERWALLNTGE